MFTVLGCYTSRMGAWRVKSAVSRKEFVNMDYDERLRRHSSVAFPKCASKARAVSSAELGWAMVGGRGFMGHALGDS